MTKEEAGAARLKAQQIYDYEYDIAWGVAHKAMHEVLIPAAKKFYETLKAIGEAEEE